MATHAAFLPIPAAAAPAAAVEQDSIPFYFILRAYEERVASRQSRSRWVGRVGGAVTTHSAAAYIASNEVVSVPFIISPSILNGSC